MSINYKGTNITNVVYKGTTLDFVYKWDGSKNVLVFRRVPPTTYSISLSWRETSRTYDTSTTTTAWDKWDDTYTQKKQAVKDAKDAYKKWKDANPKPPEINPDWTKWSEDSDKEFGKVEEAYAKYEEWQKANPKPKEYITEHNDKWDTWNTRLGVLEKALVDAKAARDTLKGKYDTAVSTYNSTRKSTYDSYYETGLNDYGYYKNKNAKTEWEGKKSGYETDLSNANGRLSSANSDISTYSGQVTRYEGEVRKAKKALDDAIAGGVPPERLEPLKQALANAEGRLSTANGNLSSAKGRKKDAEKDIEKANGNIRTAEGKIKEYSGYMENSKKSAATWATTKTNQAENTPGTSLYNANQAKNKAYNDWQAYAKVPGGYVWQDEQDIKTHKQNEPWKDREVKNPAYDPWVIKDGEEAQKVEDALDVWYAWDAAHPAPDYKNPDYDPWVAKDKELSDAITTAENARDEWYKTQPYKWVRETAYSYSASMSTSPALKSGSVSASVTWSNGKNVTLYISAGSSSASGNTSETTTTSHNATYSITLPTGTTSGSGSYTDTKSTSGSW